jgi:hypothetical protein
MNIINIMANSNENGIGFDDSRSYKNYKRYKQYKEGLKQTQNYTYIEENYFTCMYCNKINVIKDIKQEEPENRTFRAKHMSWKKLKEIANDKGGSIENAINYLIYLHEDKEAHGGASDYDINVAAGDGGGKK